MKNKKIDVISCPFCHREYLPAEIFYPDKFLGKPYDIQRDYTGKILDYFDDDIDSAEVYVCDSCNKQFKVSTKITFTVDTKSQPSFEEESVIKIKKPELFLNEV